MNVNKRTAAGKIHYQQMSLKILKKETLNAYKNNCSSVLDR
jgi:hypothetical protein